MIPNDRFNSGLHRWQLEILAAFDGGAGRLARFFVMEWHRRARKTTLALNLLIRECVEYSKRSYVYVAPTYTQARNIVWDDPNMLPAYLPTPDEMPCKKNQQKLHVQFGNGSLLNIRGAVKPDSRRGIDAQGVVFDEWAMMKEEAWIEIFRPIIAQSPQRWAMFLYTPKGINHATEMFDRVARISHGQPIPNNGLAGDCIPDWVASRLVASKSGLLTPSELEKAARDMPTSMYDQEIECARVTDEDRVLITSRMIDALRDIHRYLPETRRVISCDPSMGGDECVIYAGENTKIIDELILHERDQMKIAGHLAIMGERHKINTYIIDRIGIGKGINDRLAEMGKEVIPFCASETALVFSIWLRMGLLLTRQALRLSRCWKLSVAVPSFPMANWMT